MGNRSWTLLLTTSLKNPHLKGEPERMEVSPNNFGIGGGVTLKVMVTVRAVGKGTNVGRIGSKGREK
jgi:hypothetical protein